MVDISGENVDGRASVYVDLNAISVITSTYYLGLMDAFVGYEHIAGSASKSSGTLR